VESAAVDTDIRLLVNAGVANSPIYKLRGVSKNVLTLASGSFDKHYAHETTSIE